MAAKHNWLQYPGIQENILDNKILRLEEVYIVYINVVN